MGTTVRSKINGGIDTGLNVYDNIQKIATAAGCYVTWDPGLGKWTFILNEPSDVVFEFDDSNIISGIDVTKKPLEQKYNRVTVQYPHVDLKDKVDTVTFRLPQSEWHQNEKENSLNINLDLVNDPVQAQLIAARELKQSRLDISVTFSADFSAFGLRAGDVVRITNNFYNWSSSTSNILFKIVSITEVDADDGSLYFDISAVLYDTDVYSTDGLVREERNTNTGIPPKELNVCIAEEDGNKIIQDQLASSSASGLSGNFVGTAESSLINISDFNAPHDVSDGAFFFVNGSAVFDPDDPTYRFETNILFTAPLTGVYAIDRILRTLYVVVTDQSGQWLVTDAWRTKVALGYEINNNSTIYLGNTSVTKDVSFVGQDQIAFDVLPVPLNQGDTVRVYIFNKNDFRSYPDTNNLSQVYTTTTIKVFYLG